MRLPTSPGGPQPRTGGRAARACACAVLALGLVACGGSAAAPEERTTSATGTASPSASGTASPPASGSPSVVTSGTAAGAKVSANTASEGEIATALEAAGVGNAGRWAEEVVEYRPYPADDPDLTKLRDNLAKYNPGQETTDRIVSALAP